MKTLQLTGLDTYISPLTKFTPIKRGQVVTVNDTEAARILQGTENPNGAEIPHWTVVSDSTPADFHFSNEIPADQIAVTQPVPRHHAHHAPAPTKVPEPTELTADEQAVAAKIAAAQSPEMETKISVPEGAEAAVEKAVKTQRVARKGSANKQ